MPPIANRWNLPDPGLGLGLRGKHIPTILKQNPEVGWFEVIADNALVQQGWMRHALDALAERYPLVLHGVTMNLGSTDPLDLDYLKQIKVLADRWRVPWLSDHLCWTGIDGRQSHDLLPVPYSDEMLAWLTRRVRLVQDVLERPLVLENPSSYLKFHQSTLPEWQFLAQLATDADCGLLLDVNNVYVSAVNHAFAWQDYLAAVPWERVCQFHVAGHTTFETHLFDSHIGPVDAPVWEVLRAAFAACGGRPLLLEWDFAIPSFAQTWREAQAAWARVADLRLPLPVHAPIAPLPPPPPLPVAAPAAAALMRWMLDEVTGRATGVPAEQWIAREGRLAPDERLRIHSAMYARRCDDALAEDFPLVRKRLGAKPFAAAAAGYRLAVPSTSWALEHYGARVPAGLAGQPDLPPDAAALAQLERAQTEAHLARACPPLDVRALATLAAADQGRLVLHFAPATQLVQLDHAVLPAAPGPQAWLVTRARWQVRRRRLHPVEARLLAELLTGVALGPAIAAVGAMDVQNQAQLAAKAGRWLAAWVRAGAIARVELP